MDDPSQRQRTDAHPGPEFLSVKLEEYKTLRAEVLLSLQQGQSVLNFGVAALGVLLGFALNQLEGYIGALVTMFAIPIIALIMIVVWLGEWARTMRLGQYIKHEIERPVRTWFEPAGGPPLNWETWIDNGTRRGFGTRPEAVPALLLLIALLSAVAGAVRLARGDADPAIVSAIAVAALAAWVGAARYTRSLLKDIAEVRTTLFPSQADGN